MGGKDAGFDEGAEQAAQVGVRMQFCGLQRGDADGLATLLSG